MKLFTAALLLGALAAVSAQQTSNLRANSSRDLAGQDEVVYGTFLEADIQYADRTTDGHADAVALPDGTILDITDDDDADEDVKKRGRGWFRKHGYESGNSQIALTGRVEGSKFKLKKLPGDNTNANNGKGLAKGKNKRRLEEDRRRLTTGTKTVLALRVVAPDVSTSSSMAQISDEIFGTGADVINLKSQYAACSHDQLMFEPFDGTTTSGVKVENGVGEVTISQTVTGVANSVIRNAVTAAGNAKFGTMYSQFNYVMQCLPPGTSGGWIAYAYVNWYLSVYNNEWCNYPSAQLHEIGHNIGLAHSGEGTAAYDDQSGMMGYSYGQDEGPEMCFNAAKNYQLGWFDDRFTEINLAEKFDGTLIGQAEYDIATATDADSQQVGVRITGAAEDYYVSFNRKTKNNDGTKEGADQVLIHKRTTGTGYAPSTLLAKLSAGGSYTIPATSFKITVGSIDTNSEPWMASVTAAVPTPPPTNPPTTNPPTNPPPTNPPPTNPPPTNPPTTNPPTNPPPTNPPPTNPPTNPPPTNSPPTNPPTTNPPTNPPPTNPPPTNPPTTNPPTNPPPTNPPPTNPPTTNPPTNPPPTNPPPTNPPTTNPPTNPPPTNPPTNPPPVVTKYICHKFTRSASTICLDGTTASCGEQGARCGNGGKYCQVATCGGGTPPAPAPTNPPPPGPGPTGCIGLGNGACKSASGCRWSKGSCLDTSGGTEFCSGKNGYCSDDGDCCSGFCKATSRCS